MTREIEEGVEFLRRNDKILMGVIEVVGDCRIKKSDDFFDNLLKSIISQQLSVKAANTIYKRIISLCITLNPENIRKLQIENLRGAGVSYQKSYFLQQLADYFINKKPTKNTYKNLTDEEVIEELSIIKGVGEWTAQMFLIFSLNRLNVLPLNDVGFRRSFVKQYSIREKENLSQIIIDKSQKWGDFKSIAVWYLWRILDKYSEPK